MIFIILIMLIPATQMLLALIAAFDLWQQSNAYMRGAERTTLRCLALSLVEPAFNGVLITILYLGPMHQGLEGVLNVRTSFLTTASMAVLLAPLLWVRIPNPICRGVLLRLSLLGALRWATTMTIFIHPVVFPFGLGLLGFSIRWVKRQGAAISVRPQAEGLGPDGVIVAPASDFSGDDHPGMTF
jgi:hypothetical protein